MAKQSPSDVARTFFTSIARAKSCDPIYFVWGEESYLLDHAVEALIKLAAPEGTNAFNFESFHGKETDGGKLLSAVETLPFMTKQRVVVVRDLQEMDLTELDALKDYFADPSPSTCLILHAMTAQNSIDGRKGIVKKLKKAATTCEFKAFYERDVESFLTKQAKDRGLVLDRQAQAYFLEAVGSTLSSIDAALEKLDLFMGASESVRAVSAEHVKEIIADTAINTIFDLTDALGDRQLERALRILDQMLVNGRESHRHHGHGGRHFRKLALLHDPSLRNASKNERAKAVGVHPFFLKDYERHAKKFSLDQIERILEQAVDVDHALKSSRLSEQVIIERLFFDIAQGRAA